MSKYKESISSIMSTKEEVKMLVFGLTVIAGGTFGARSSYDNY